MVSVHQKSWFESWAYPWLLWRQAQYPETVPKNMQAMTVCCALFILQIRCPKIDEVEIRYDVFHKFNSRKFIFT